LTRDGGHLPSTAPMSVPPPASPLPAAVITQRAWLLWLLVAWFLACEVVGAVSGLPPVLAGGMPIAIAAGARELALAFAPHATRSELLVTAEPAPCALSTRRSRARWRYTILGPRTVRGSSESSIRPSFTNEVLIGGIPSGPGDHSARFMSDPDDPSRARFAPCFARG
jgi:hypothetical protein